MGTIAGNHSVSTHSIEYTMVVNVYEAANVLSGYRHNIMMILVAQYHKGTCYPCCTLTLLSLLQVKQSVRKGLYAMQWLQVSCAMLKLSGILYFFFLFSILIFVVFAMQ